MGVYVTARLKDDGHATLAEFAEAWLGRIVYPEMVTVYREIYKRYEDKDTSDDMCHAWFDVVSSHDLWSLDPTWWEYKGEKALSVTLGKVTHLPEELDMLFDDTCGDVPQERWEDVAMWYGCKKFRADLVTDMHYG